MHRDRFPIPAMSVRNCDFPWHWVLVVPTPKIPSGLVDVTTGHTHDVVW